MHGIRLNASAFRSSVDAFNDRAVQLWNAGKLEEFCEGYAEDATYVTSKGLVKGRENILRSYQEACPDRSRMGQISTELVELRIPTGGTRIPDDYGSTSIGVGIVYWKVEVDGVQTEDGYSMVTFLNCPSSGIVIVQDTST